MPKYWLVMAFGHDRHYQGNRGYTDTISKQYEYDSHGGNHKNVSVGDVIILRSRAEFLGAGVVERIDAVEPMPGSHGIGPGRTRMPASAIHVLTVGSRSDRYSRARVERVVFSMCRFS